MSGPLSSKFDFRAMTGTSAAPASPLALVVDDDVEVNRFIEEGLGEPYRVAMAYDGKEGLAKAIELQPDITDIMMPVMSGDEFVQAIRTRRELDGTPIIVLTAMADDQARVRLLREGAQDLPLSKPFSLEELRSLALSCSSTIIRQAIHSTSQLLTEGLLSRLSML
jgi:CheY-like chemotaxis protein